MLFQLDYSSSSFQVVTVTVTVTHILIKFEDTREEYFLPEDAELFLRTIKLWLTISKDFGYAKRRTFIRLHNSSF